MNNRSFGIDGETEAAEYLVTKGYKILERNFLAACGEIDLIALDGKTIVFVEVKKRSTARYGQAKEAVTETKKRKIALTAALYLKAHRKIDAAFRFDVVAIDGDTVTHLKSAFESTVLM